MLEEAVIWILIHLAKQQSFKESQDCVISFKKESSSDQLKLVKLAWELQRHLGIYCIETRLRMTHYWVSNCITRLKRGESCDTECWVNFIPASGELWASCWWRSRPWRGARSSSSGGWRRGPGPRRNPSSPRLHPPRRSRPRYPSPRQHFGGWRHPPGWRMARMRMMRG